MVNYIQGRNVNFDFEMGILVSEYFDLQLRLWSWKMTCPNTNVVGFVLLDL